MNALSSHYKTRYCVNYFGNVSVIVQVIVITQLIYCDDQLIAKALQIDCN